MRTQRLLPISLFLLLWWWSLPVLSQAKTDSLLQRLSAPSLTVDEEIALCEQLAAAYIYSDFGQSRMYAKRGLALAHKSGKQKDEGMLYRHLSVAYELNGIADSSRLCKLRMLSIGRETGDEALENLAIFYLGNGCYATSSFNSAIYYYQKALPYYERTDEAKANAIRANIGTVYVVLGVYDKAKPYFIEAYDVARRLNDKPTLGQVCHELHTICQRQGQYEEALRYAQEAVAIFREADRPYHLAVSLQALVLEYERRCEFDKAIPLAEEGIRIAEQHGYTTTLSGSELSLGSCYVETGQYSKAIPHLDRALAYADTTDLRHLVNIYESMHKQAVMTGDKAAAIGYHDMETGLLERLAGQELMASLSEMEVKYETERKEMEIATLHAGKRFWLILTLVACMAVIGLLTTLILLNRYQRQKRLRMKERYRQLEQEKELIAARSLLDGENTERVRLSRELHDGLGGLLTMVKLDLERMKCELNKGKECLDGVICLTEKSIKEMRRFAHNLMPESLARFGLRPVLEDFCHNAPGVGFHFYGEERRLPAEVEIHFYRIACELINNALKHAEASAINVQLILSEGRLSLTVQDDGKGFPSAVKENGLVTVRSRVELLGATLNIYSGQGNGTEITIELTL